MQTFAIKLSAKLQRHVGPINMRQIVDGVVVASYFILLKHVRRV